MSLDPSASVVGTASKAPEVNAEHPWLGLLPYKEEHREFFFGRDREVEDILGRIRDNSLTVLYGQSGWGKSSLLAAGVVPRLRETGFAPKIIRLRYSERATLREQMLAKLPNCPPFTGSALDPSWQPGKATLWELFHRKTSATPEQPITVLIFDQFEEIFTLGAQPDFVNQVADWLEQMADLLQNRPPRQLAERFTQNGALAEQYHFGAAPVRIVFTLREDYLAQLEQWKGKLPLLMQNRMALTLLSGPQARQAVLGPAQLGDHSLVSREVAESIVRRVAGAAENTPLEQIKAVPPFLSLLCEQLNAARFDSKGDAKLPIISAEMVHGDSDTILQDFYEKTFLRFEETHGKLVRAWVEDSFITQTEPAYRNTLIRGEAEGQLTRAGVAGAKAIFDTLIQRRLITAEMRDQVQRLEITHDVLVPLLVRSRKERQDREAKEQAERVAVATRAEEGRLDKERLRQRFLGAMIVLSLVAVGFAVYGLWQANQAHSALGVAKEEREKNFQILHEASIADYATAVRRIETDGEWDQGVAYLARALKLEPSNKLAAARLYSTLSFHASEKQSLPREILRHEADVFSAQFNNDGTRIVTIMNRSNGDPFAAPAGEAQIWDAVNGRRIGGPLPHGGNVTDAQFSADGARIVTASDDKTARVWDSANGRPVGEPLPHESEVRSAAFSTDGTRIVTISSGNTARVWDAASGRLIGEPLRHGAEVGSIAFSADGTRIVSVSKDQTARVWDAASGRPIGEPMRHEGKVYSAQFSADGTRVVTTSEDKTARVWDAASGMPLGEPLRHEDSVYSAQFSPDGTRIITVSSDNLARVWNTAGRPLGKPMRHESSVASARFSADGMRIVTASHDKTARVWAAASGTPLGGPLHHGGTVGSAQFSADGMRIVTASSDKTARVWDAASGRPIGEPLRDEGSVMGAQFSADGTRIVTAGNSARVWDAVGDKPNGKLILHSYGVVSSAQFSTDGTRIVTASKDKTARVWDAASGRQLGEPMSHDDSVSSAQFSADGSLIVTASKDKTARVWDAASGRQIGESMSHDDSVWSAQFNADGTRIVTASEDKTARVWDAASGRQIGESMRHDDSVTSAQFNADGTLIVTASEDNTARVWDAASGRQLGEAMSHDGSVASAQFSADGTLIVTASEDNTARVWDATSGAPLCEPMRHEDEVYSAQFSADGMTIVTASKDNTARMWDVDSGRQLGEAMGHDNSVASAQFSADGTRIVTASDDQTARLWDVKSILHLPLPVPEWMLLRAQAVAGLQFDKDGQLTPIPDEQRLRILHEPTSDTDLWADLARWLALPVAERTLTPDSRFTCRQIAERERDSGTEEGIESALRYDPSVPLAHLLLAGFARDPQRAAFLRNYRFKGLPEDATLLSLISSSLTNQKQPVLALEAARKAVAQDASLIAARRALAYALAASGKQTEALQSWDKVLADQEATFIDFCDAGYLAAELNLGDKARAIFREGEKRFPTIPRILRFKGKALLLLHAPAEALAALENYGPKVEATNAGPVVSEAFETLAVSRWLTGDKDGAVAEYLHLIGVPDVVGFPEFETGYNDADVMAKSNWPDAIKQPLLEVLAETLKRHPELRPKKEKKAKDAK